MSLPLGVAAAVLAAPSAALAGEYFAGQGESATNFVASGATLVEDGRLVTTEGGRVEKSGAGTWVLPANVRTAYHPLAVDVKEGAVSFPAAAGGVPTNPVPSCISEMAAMWLDASAGTSLDTRIEGESTFVDNWYDVRETSPETPKRWYAKANLGSTINDNPNHVWTFTASAPELKEKEGLPMIWFGGHSSSRSMTWFTPAGFLDCKRFTSNVRHVFVLRGAWDTWDTIVGAIKNFTQSGIDSTQPTPLLAASQYGTNGGNGTYSCADAIYLRNARLYENGVRVDPVTTYPCKGLALLDFSTVDEPFSANTFFNYANYIGAGCTWHAGDRGGGEYIAEAIVFTNVLTETQRLQIEGYLMHKWLGAPTAKTTDVRLSSSAVVELMSADTSDVTVSGNGSLRISTDGDMAFSSKDRTLPSASLKLGLGAATLTKTMPLAVSAGDQIDAPLSEDGPRVTRTAAAADALVKTGAGSVSIADFPSGVKTLDVRAGRVTIRPKGADVITTRSPIPVPIANPGFEEGWTDAQKQTGYQSLYNSSFSGWTTEQTISGTSDGYLYYWPSGVRGPGTGWNLRAAPVEGDCYILIRTGLRLSTPVTIPETGTYELSFVWAGRNGYASGQVSVALVSADRSVTNAFGRVIVFKTDEFRTCYLRHHVTAGAYRLAFTHLNAEDRPILIDDVRLARVFPADDGTYAVPGGDFEGATFANAAALKGFATGGTVDGWALGESAGPATFLESPRDQNITCGTLYNDSRLGRLGSGFVQLALTNATSVTTTFRPPSGLWRLKAALDCFGDRHSKLTATVTTGGATTSLGSATAPSHFMEDVTWPTAFEVDGDEDVTLTLTFDNAAYPTEKMLVDDVRLVKATAVTTELVKNGGFENSFDESSDPTANWRTVKGRGVNSTASWMGYSSQASHWGYARYEGAYRLNLTADGFAYQTLTFPAAGHYRLSFHMSHRCEPDYPTWGNYGRNPVRVWLTRGEAYTNVIATVTEFTTNYVQQVYDFAVPEAGAWDLAFGGTSLTDLSSLVDGVSVTAIDVAETAPAFDPELTVSVAAGARLDLSYVGTNDVGRIRLGGRTVSGVVSAETHPDYICGFGALRAERKGTIILVQ